MVDFMDFDESKLPDYTIDDLRGFINAIEMRRSVLSEKCSSEMAVYLQNDSFDIYSFRGSRKIKKIAIAIFFFYKLFNSFTWLIRYLGFISELL